MGPAHYANGFHATATVGGLGAAMACAHLLRLTREQACHALGLAATQAAGLKAMFGSMAKPLHAGMAAQAGLRSALLAQRGFISRADVLECGQGYARVHGADFHEDAALAQPPGRYHLLGNLFKFHAACFSTHATIEAVAGLRREHGLAASALAGIEVRVDESCAICNIQAPATGLEAKFSLKAAAALAWLGADTGRLDSWDQVGAPEVRAVMDKVRVTLAPGASLSRADVTLRAGGGPSLRRAVDCSVPMADKAAQSRRVADKFLVLAGPVIGTRRSRALLSRLQSLAPGDSMAGLLDEVLVRAPH